MSVIPVPWPLVNVKAVIEALWRALIRTEHIRLEC